jgi:hypothetical protein
MSRMTVLFLLSLFLILLPFTVNAECMLVQFQVKGRVAYEGAPAPPAGASVQLRFPGYEWTTAQPGPNGEFVVSSDFDTHSSSCFGRDRCNSTVSTLHLRVLAPGFEAEKVDIPVEGSAEQVARTEDRWIVVRSAGTITMHRSPA